MNFWSVEIVLGTVYDKTFISSHYHWRAHCGGLRRRRLLADNTHPNEHSIDGEYRHDGQWYITV